MTPEPLGTDFAPAERAGAKDVERQSRLVSDTPLLVEIAEAAPAFMLILNRQRQIIHANGQFLAFIGQPSLDDVRGRRPGEALRCIHSGETAGGCGTTWFCGECGAVRAILASHERKSDVQECRITLRDLEALDLRVWASPLMIRDEGFTCFSAIDISNEKRRRSLERFFYHDLNNNAQAISGFAELVAISSSEERVKNFAGEIIRAVARLTGEIGMQRMLSMAESCELVVKPAALDTLPLLREIVEQVTVGVAQNGRVRIDEESVNVRVVSDQVLLGWVLFNMLKNALEATSSSETVLVGCGTMEGMARFWAANPGVIPRNVQAQIFQRSFSTKAADRGLGTYGMKLLGERYLGGRVTFVSNEQVGTLFSVILPLQPETPATEA